MGEFILPLFLSFISINFLFHLLSLFLFYLPYISQITIVISCILCLALPSRPYYLALSILQSEFYCYSILCNCHVYRTKVVSTCHRRYSPSGTSTVRRMMSDKTESFTLQYYVFGTNQNYLPFLFPRFFLFLDYYSDNLRRYAPAIAFIPIASCIVSSCLLECCDAFHAYCSHSYLNRY
jgi:hypothetical protein